MKAVIRSPKLEGVKNVCLYAFLALTTVIFLYQYNSTMFNLRYAFMAVGALFGYWSCFAGAKKFQAPVLLLLSLLFCWIFCYLGQQGYSNYSLSNFLYTVIYIGLSVLILQNEYNHTISILLYAFAALTIMLRIVQNVNMNHILLANSRNYISVLLLLPLLFYYISCHDKGKPILVSPAILYFYICICAVGRGGIVSSGFLTIALIIYKVRKVENKNLRRLLWLVVVIIFATSLIYISGLETATIDRFLNTYFSRFILKGITDVSRQNVWTAFFENNKQSVSTFLFGSNVLLARSDGNLHNSFLQAYASFGLVGFLIIMGLSLKSLITGIRKKDSLWVILFIGLILRAFTDRLFYQGYCEVLIYYFILYWYFNNNRMAVTNLEK